MISIILINCRVTLDEIYTRNVESKHGEINASHNSSVDATVGAARGA